MALISLPDDKKFSQHRSRHFSWMVSGWGIEWRSLKNTLPFSFSLTCLSEKSQEGAKNVRRVFDFFFDPLPMPKAHVLPWLISHLPMMAWEADSLPGTLSVFFLAKALFKDVEAVRSGKKTNSK